MDNDEVLMQRVISGSDTRAFSLLVTRHQARLLRFAARLTSSMPHRDIASDIVQEAFLRLWRIRERYQSRGCLEGFLLRTVRNLCLDHLRAAHPEGSLENGLEFADTNSDPQKLSQSEALANAVRCAVQSLPETQRAVFVLSHYEELSYVEIADVLGCPVGTVASRKHLAVETLRRKLHAWRDEP